MLKQIQTNLLQDIKDTFIFFPRVYWIDRKRMHTFIYHDISWQFAVQTLIYIRNNHLSNYRESL